MSVRRLCVVVFFTVGLAISVLAPAIASARIITLKATAVLPGSTSPRTFAMPLRDGPSGGLLSGATVVARPDASTLVVEFRLDRDHLNGSVPAPTAACVRATLKVALVTGHGGPLAVARQLLPEAQTESSTIRSRHSPRTSSAFRGWWDVGMGSGDLLAANSFSYLYVADQRWSKPAQRGQAVFGIRAERLSRSGPCTFVPGYGDIFAFADTILPPWLLK